MITIITTTLNSSWCISECIESVIKSCHSIKQFIIIDGGSSDNTLSIINEYAQQYSFIQVFSLPGSSIYEAWNYGTKFIKEKFVQFLGSDDRLIPDAYDKVIKYLEIECNNQKQIHHFGLFKLFTRTDNISRRYRSPLGNYSMIDECIPHIPPNPSTIYNSSIFKDYIFDESYRYSADAHFYFLLSKNRASINCYDIPIVVFNDTGVTNSKRTRLTRSMEKLRIMCEFFPDYSFYPRSYLGLIKSAILRIVL